MAKNLPISEARTRLAELVRAVEKREEEFVITRKGKRVAVLVNYAHMRALETIDVLTDPDLMQQIRASQKFFAAGGKGLSLEEVFNKPLVPRRRKR